MKIPPIYRGIFIIVFIIPALLTKAQEKPEIRAGIDKNKILIGEQIHLTLDANFPQTEAIRFFYIDSIPHFEIVERSKIDTIDRSGKIDLKQVLTLTSFDTGRYFIPQFELQGQEPLLTDSIPVEVNFSNFDSSQAYHDIKDILPVEKKENKTNWTWFIVATVVILGLIVYIATRKKTKKAARPVVEIDPFKEAMIGLEELRKTKIHSKEYYTSLTGIFRNYVFRKKGITSLQRTMDDLMVELQGINMPSAEFSALAQTLRMSDSVKFAKYQPSLQEEEESFYSIKRSIEIIEKTSGEDK
jgi:hypothetical protein